MMTHPRLLFVSFCVLMFASTTTVRAEPILQIYLDGATYDATTETWVINSSSFDLWVIGNVEQGGTISDVNLSAAVLTSEAGAGSISLTPTTTSALDDIPSLGDIGDPSTPGAPIANGLSADGAVPTKSDGSSLATHGIYGTAGVSFFEWELGDFTLMDSPIGDFITAFPTSFSKTGQVNVYEVNVTGFTSGVHFDAYDTIFTSVNHTKTVFAPFSHDGEGFPFPPGDGQGGEPVVPEPSTLILWSLGAVAAFGFRRRHAA